MARGQKLKNERVYGFVYRLTQSLCSDINHDLHAVRVISLPAPQHRVSVFVYALVGLCESDLPTAGNF